MKKYIILILLIICFCISCKCEEKVEEIQTEFDVVLVDAGKRKYHVIIAIDKNTNNNYLKSRKLAKNTPSIIAENIDEKTANKLKEKLEEEGATVQIK